MKILLIEDNNDIKEVLTYTLEKENYQVFSVSSIKETKKILDNQKFDLLIIDVNLPDGSGFNLYEDIKELNIKAIFLTARDLESDIVYGFKLGIDDYITKPFLKGELLARINKILKNQNKIIKIKDIKIDYDKMSVFKEDKEITLTTLEYKLLLLLVENINKVVTRDYIIDKIYELTGNDIYDNTVSVYIKRLREKLDTDIIKTIKGVGYRIDE